ncbi:CBS domain-containing protein [Candidatus Micrarchaeota archaeon]|nr:CBS domain-containing protein [Candidatus Micrarchaeota archaeon]
MYDLRKIGKIRKRLGLTQKRLAALAGVSQSLIAKIESGKIDPAYSKVVQIMAALEEKQSREKKTLEDVMTEKIISVKPSDSVEKAVRFMREGDISQIPVLDAGSCVGSLSDSSIMELLSEARGSLGDVMVGDVMAESFPALPSTSVIDIAADILRHYPAVLVKKNGRLAGIVTKADLLRTL